MKEVIPRLKIISYIIFVACIILFFIYFIFIYDNGSNNTAYRDGRINNMIFVSIIAILIIIAGLFKLYDIWKEKTSPYFKCKKKFEADLKQSNETGDWKLRQEINLQLLWLDKIKDVAIFDYNLFGRKEKSEGLILAELSKIDIRYPNKWELDEISHLHFVQEIISNFQKIFAEKEYKVYNSNSILPYPKDFIKKAIYYTLDYLSIGKPIYKIKEEEKIEVTRDLKYLIFTLYFTFIDVDQNELPKDNVGNCLTGAKFKKLQPIQNEANDLRLIDWRDENVWETEYLYFRDNNQFDYARICLEKIKELNPESENPILLENNLNHYITQYHMKTN